MLFFGIFFSLIAVLLLLLFPVISVVAYHRAGKLRRELKRLEGELKKLRADIREMTPAAKASLTTAEINPVVDVPSKPPASSDLEFPKKPQIISNTEVTGAEKTAPSALGNVAEINSTVAQLDRPGLASRWQAIEKAFVDNWTGILGSVVMVAGVGFLGVYAALKVAPVYRFFMVVALSVAFWILYRQFRTKEKWKQFGNWLGSSAVAIFLFGCLGAGGIPVLRWIENPMWALAVLGVGIAANLYFAYIEGNATFASLHTVLSVITLTLTPNETTLVVATLVVLGSILFSYRYKWDIHLFIALTSYFTFLLLWRVTLDIRQFGLLQKILGIGCVTAVGVAGGLVHYRKDYATTSFTVRQFIVHVVNWFYMGIGFAFMSTGSKWKTIPIFAAAITAYFLAKKGRRLQIEWIYRTDTVMSQAVFIVGFYSLTQWGLTYYNILAMIFAQSVLFVYLATKENEALLTQFGIRFVQVSGALLLLLGLLFRTKFESDGLLGTNATVGFSMVIGLIVHRYLLMVKGEKFDSLTVADSSGENIHLSILGAVIGLLPLIIFLNLSNLIWAEAVLAALLLTLLYFRQRLQSNGLGSALIISTVMVFALSWYSLYRPDSVFGASELAAKIAPLFALSVGSVYLSRVKDRSTAIPAPGILLTGVHTLIGVYQFTFSISPLLPGVIWIILSLGALGLFQRINARDTKRNGYPSRYLLCVGYLFIAAFFVRHYTVDIQSEIYWGVFQVRLLIELLALAVIAYWMTAADPDESTAPQIWIRVNPLLLELLILFSVAIAVLAIPNLLHPVVWGATALLLNFVAPRTSDNVAARLDFYSLLFAWASAIHLAAITSTTATAKLQWFFQPWILGVAVVIMEGIYLIRIHRDDFLLTVSEFPKGLRWISSASKTIRHRKNLWIYYPLFVSGGVFAYWRFSAAILTLVFVIESFLIFVLSIVLRVPHFRALSMGILGFCMVRLVFFDLVQTGTLTRGLVFLGVGGIMLVMNFLYKRYETRFKK